MFLRVLVLADLVVPDKGPLNVSWFILYIHLTRNNTFIRHLAVSGWIRRTKKKYKYRNNFKTHIHIHTLIKTASDIES